MPMRLHITSNMISLVPPPPPDGLSGFVCGLVKVKQGFRFPG